MISARCPILIAHVVVAVSFAAAQIQSGAAGRPGFARASGENPRPRIEGTLPIELSLKGVEKTDPGRALLITAPLVVDDAVWAIGKLAGDDIAGRLQSNIPKAHGFRLLAISNRIDLRGQTEPAEGGTAGDIAFIYCATDKAGKPLAATVMLDFAVEADPGAWANEWLIAGEAETTKLHAAAISRLWSSSSSRLKRIFTNAHAREWPNERLLRQYDERLAPMSLQREPPSVTAAREFLANQANAASIRNHSYTLPNPADSAVIHFGQRWWGTIGTNPEVRRIFSINTCSGCHSGETGTYFHHVRPRSQGQQASISAFLRADLERRRADLTALAAIAGSSAQDKQALIRQVYVPLRMIH